MMVEKNKEMEQEYIKTMLEKALFAVVFPEDKSKESAQKIVDMIDSAVGIAEFEDEDEEGKLVWGALIDKTKEAKKRVEKE